MGAREIREQASAAGRNPDSLTMSVRLDIDVAGTPSRTSGRGLTSLSGHDFGEMTAAIGAYQTAGVDHVVLAPNTGDVSVITGLMERIVGEVIPQFR